ncbi:helix-turn-helix domain-containing protein [Bordetella flabilis]|uniref:helix-turn-helix domain-containing protein n=2 Tax=Bordetella flabilis TaxID=463014 RepID=UPI0009FC5E53|nr:helix-turn-helix transcriptional regulator [Bordetella flabilis]
MNMANRLRTLMRWRGIRSQRQLARLSGVPQTSIHRILSRAEGYLPALDTLSRLARALGTTVTWLNDGDASASSTPQAQEPPHLREPQAGRQYHPECGGDAAELHMLMARLSEPERRHIVALVRLLADRPTWGAGDARRFSPSTPSGGRRAERTR